MTRLRKVTKEGTLWAVGLALLFHPALAAACDFCRPRVRAGIFDAQFTHRLALTLLPLAVVLLLVALIVWAPRRRSTRRTSQRSEGSRAERWRFVGGERARA